MKKGKRFASAKRRTQGLFTPDMVVRSHESVKTTLIVSALDH